VSRAAPAAALSLVALLLAAALGTATASAEAGPACAWTRHSKRVVRSVRRGGRARRVTRVKHWWTCDPLPPSAPTVAPASGPTLPPPTPPPAEEAPPSEASALGVKSAEWSYTLSRPEIPAGEVVVELNNMGGDPHDLNIRAEGSDGPALQIPVTGPSQHASKRFTLAAGTYRLWCDLDGHDEKGMHATLVVDG
jgi:plastocyanin